MSCLDLLVIMPPFAMAMNVGRKNVGGQEDFCDPEDRLS